MDPSFGNWCGTMRYYYNTIARTHTKEQIDRLDEIALNLKSEGHLSSAVMLLTQSRASLGIVIFPAKTW